MPVTLPPGRDKLCTYPCKIGSKLAARSTIGTSGRAAAAACSPDWLKLKNAAAPAVKREADEDWGRPVFCQQAEGGSLLPAAPTLPKLLLDQADVTAVSRQAYVAWF
jgi:hypothetical protein